MPTDPSKTNAPILDRAGIEAIGLEILRSSTDPPGQRLRRLRGYRGRDSFILRRELWHGGAPMQDLAMSLPRRNSPEAHALRRVLIDTAPAGTFEYAVRSLHHCPGPEAHAFRVELLDRGASLREVAGSLRGCDGKLDHALRQWLLEKGASTVCIANSLRGCNSPASLTLRRELLASGAHPGEIVASLLLSRPTDATESLLRELRPAGRGNIPTIDAPHWPTEAELRGQADPATWIDTFFFRLEDDQRL